MKDDNRTRTAEEKADDETLRELDDAIEMLSWMSGLEYGVKRKNYAKTLGLTLEVLDREVKAKRRERGDGVQDDPAGRIVEIARETFSFGVSTLDEPFAVPKQGPKIVMMFGSKRRGLSSQLAKLYLDQTSEVARSAAVSDAVAVLRADAEACEPVELNMRVAETAGALWLDLGDATGRAVRITAKGWVIESDVPVLFRRTSLTVSLPEPARKGDVSLLWKRLNVVQEDRPLVLAAQIASLFPAIVHPVTMLQGEGGAGKTTAMKLLTGLIDPTTAPVRSPPRGIDQFITAAKGSWTVGFDNLSDIPTWLSDAICRLATGDGDVRRELYSDDGLAVFSQRRCIYLTSIGLGTLRGDLIARALPVNLDLIPARKRVGEAGLWDKWKDEHPAILGGLLDLAVRVLSALPGIKLSHTGHLIDFARILTAIDGEMRTSGLKRYLDLQERQASETMSSNMFITVLAELCRETLASGRMASAAKRGFMDGCARRLSSAELFKQCTGHVERRGGLYREPLPEGWPHDAGAVTQLLKREGQAMRLRGWRVSDDGGNNHNKILRWDIQPPAKDPDE